MEDENQGSLLIGLLLGFFLGCIGVIIAVFVVKGSKTTTGSIIGTLAQFLLWVCIGGGLAVLQIALMNS
jgi:hypothetical protein